MMPGRRSERWAALTQFLAQLGHVRAREDREVQGHGRMLWRPGLNRLAKALSFGKTHLICIAVIGSRPGPQQGPGLQAPSAAVGMYDRNLQLHCKQTNAPDHDVRQQAATSLKWMVG